MDFFANKGQKPFPFQREAWNAYTDDGTSPHDEGDFPGSPLCRNVKEALELTWRPPLGGWSPRSKVGIIQKFQGVVELAKRFLDRKMMPSNKDVNFESFVGIMEPLPEKKDVGDCRL